VEHAVVLGDGDIDVWLFVCRSDPRDDEEVEAGCARGEQSGEKRLAPWLVRTVAWVRRDSVGVVGGVAWVGELGSGA
jgi:hypothetical protein